MAIGRSPTLLRASSKSPYRAAAAAAATQFAFCGRPATGRLAVGSRPLAAAGALGRDRRDSGRPGSDPTPARPGLTIRGGIVLTFWG